MGIRISDILCDPLACWPAELIKADMAGNLSYFDISANYRRLYCNGVLSSYLHDCGTTAIYNSVDGFYSSLACAYDAILDACLTTDDFDATAGTRHELYEEMDMIAIWRLAVERWTGPKDFTGFTSFLRLYGHERY